MTRIAKLGSPKTVHQIRGVRSRNPGEGPKPAIGAGLSVFWALASFFGPPKGETF